MARCPIAKQPKRRSRAARPAPARGAHARELRIIGGAWRGRKLRFPAGSPIRPTPDRVRETLFNWLGPRIVGARALDLFAGSGALGLEALSRGAAAVTFVERDAPAVQALRERLRAWGASGAQVVHADALAFLAGAPRLLDCVFLDPPFDSTLLAAVAPRLAAGWLAPGALLYLEHPARAPLPALPGSWQALRDKQAGEVGYHLFQAGG